MEKMCLAVDELRVQSFATSPEPSPSRGTVRAHDAATDAVECPTAYFEWDTCWESCAGSCDCSVDCGGSRWCSWDCGGWTVSRC